LIQNLDQGAQRACYKGLSASGQMTARTHYSFIHSFMAQNL